MIDNVDIIHLKETVDKLEEITNKLCVGLTELGGLKAKLAVKDAEVKGLVERKKFLEEDIRVQKKRLDNLPK
ncbi:MAG: hypothetical protein KKD77_20895 [Gammaproteobacteria bacterium]|nr:hypothetical protein [Gammaproteobacteria bacterium]